MLSFLRIFRDGNEVDSESEDASDEEDEDQDSDNESEQDAGLNEIIRQREIDMKRKLAEEEDEGEDDEESDDSGEDEEEQQHQQFADDEEEEVKFIRYHNSQKANIGRGKTAAGTGIRQ